MISRQPADEARPLPYDSNLKRFVDSLLALLVILSVVVLPVVVDLEAAEPYRAAKSALLRGLGLGCFALLSIRSLIIRSDNFWKLDPALRLSIAVIGWTAIATITSGNPRVSSYSLVTVAGVAAIFLATQRLARFYSMAPFYLLYPAAVINTVVYVIQERQIWTPVISEGTAAVLDAENLRLLREAGLLGNPNDIGSFLLVPALAAIGLVITDQPRRRPIHVIALLVLFVGLLWSRNLTAIISFSVALLTLAARRSRTAATAAVVTLVVCLLLAFQFVTPFRSKATDSIAAARAGAWNKVVSVRFAPFATGLALTRDNPVFGIGPGRFAGDYFFEKMELVRKFPWLGETGEAFKASFVEVHCDHLEVSAETGLPGYILFLVTLFTLAKGSFSPPSSITVDDSRPRRFAREMSLPFAVALAFLTLGQFPLQLAATLAQHAFVLGLCNAWGADETA